MDWGYPQVVSAELLSKYIKSKHSVSKPHESAEKAQKISKQITGKIDWRDGDKEYKKNEVWIDVLEDINVLISASGNVLRNDVSGRIVMKPYVSGMPEMKFGLNDKLQMESEEDKPRIQKKRRKKRVSPIAIDDIQFHRCVRLGHFDVDRTISFVPPDGQFDLMRYRITQNIKIPFVVKPDVIEHGTNRVEYNILVKSKFPSRIMASLVKVNIPVPKNTHKCDIKVQYGRAKFVAENSTIVWKIRQFTGASQIILRADALLTPLIKPKPWVRPPLTMNFQIPVFTPSGIYVRFLEVRENKMNYSTTRWVRYVTKAGNYQIRLADQQEIN